MPLCSQGSLSTAPSRVQTPEQREVALSGAQSLGTRTRSRAGGGRSRPAPSVLAAQLTRGRDWQRGGRAGPGRGERGPAVFLSRPWPPRHPAARAAQPPASRHVPAPASAACAVRGWPHGRGAQPQPAGNLEDPQRERLAGATWGGPRLRAHGLVPAEPHPGTVCDSPREPAPACSRGEGPGNGLAVPQSWVWH